MSRFTKLFYDENSVEKLLTVGAGCVFDEIYKSIRPKKRNIVGGGGSVGIGGWLMGGGYSLKTNQFGLGIDNLVRAQIVLPDGSEIVTAQENGTTKEGELFKAIKVCTGLEL